jgi:ABC-type nitrate/sulfonate/bicarbonate transport system permease component
MIVGSDGLGHMMSVAYRTSQTPVMYVSIITMSILGFLLDRSCLMARRHLLAWSVEGTT